RSPSGSLSARATSTRQPAPAAKAASMMSRPSLDVAVVGGGIGGLTAAIALVRKGINVTVYEQAPRLLPVGASLALGPNATRLLGALDLMEPVRRVGVAADAVELLRWSDGTVLLHTE